MIPQTLTNMNLFIDGTSYAGVASEVSLPKLKRKSEEMRNGGMDAPVKIGLGMEIMEASFSVTGMTPDILAQFGLADDTAFNGVFRGAYKNLKGEVVPVIATMRGMIDEIDFGSWKPGDKAETKFTLAPSYYKLEIAGQVVYEIDPVGMVRIINGTDELAAERAAIGL